MSFGVHAADPEQESVCGLLHRAELKELRLNNADCIEKANSVATNQFGTSVPLTARSCDWWTVDKPPTHVSMIVLPLDVAARLRTELRDARLAAEGPGEAATECIAVAEFITVCRGIVGNTLLNVMLSASPTEDQPVPFAKVRKYFDLVAARLTTNERPIEVWSQPPGYPNPTVNRTTCSAQ